MAGPQRTLPPHLNQAPSQPPHPVFAAPVPHTDVQWAGSAINGPAALITDLQFFGSSYGFFQATRLIKRMEGARGQIGTDLPARDEAIRFSVSNSLAFPKKDLMRIVKRTHPETRARLFEIEATFLGLHGANSPLPSGYVHEFAQGDYQDNTRKQFFDFFHHRLLSLLYRAWEKYRYFVIYNPLENAQRSTRDRSARREDAFTQRMFAFLGLYFPELRDIQVRAHPASLAQQSESIPWIRLLSFSGLIASHSRSASMLSNVLGATFLSEEERAGTHLYAYQSRHDRGEDPRDYIEAARFTARPFLQRTVDIPRHQQWALGQKNTTLSKDSILGRRVRDIQGKFGFTLGRLSFQRFMDFLPSGRMHQPLRTLLRFLIKDQNSVELSVKIDMQGRPEFRLEKESALRLGWSTFLGNVREQTRSVRVSLLR